MSKRVLVLGGGVAGLTAAHELLAGLPQQQFWKDYSLAEVSDGRVRGCLSVEISDWDAVGSNRRCARECSRAEVIDEVWHQLQRALPELRDIEYVAAFLYPDIVQAKDNPHHEINLGGQRLPHERRAHRMPARGDAVVRRSRAATRTPPF